MVYRCHTPVPAPFTATAHVASALADVNFTFTQLDKKIKIDVNVNKPFKNVTDKYAFHIHEALVQNNDCATTGLHLDPAKLNPGGKSETYKCRKEDFTTCEIGDLSGKFQKLDAEPKKYTFFDTSDYTVQSLVDVRSVVIHAHDKSRIGCANIVKA